jgi:ABC-type polysaccharide/polyol phosphate transport system ATPase subunit
VARVSKIYRRYSQRKQFATLKSALLSRSLITNLKPDETFTALNDVNLTVPKARTLGVIGRNGSGKSTLLKLVAGITKPSTGTVRVDGKRLGPHRAGRRVSPRDLRPGERLHQRHHARVDEAPDHRASTRSSSSPR